MKAGSVYHTDCLKYYYRVIFTVSHFNMTLDVPRVQFFVYSNNGNHGVSFWECVFNSEDEHQ